MLEVSDFTIGYWIAETRKLLTEHQVTVSEANLERLGGGRSPEAFVRDCFAFLLEREPKESILSSFDVSVIGRYFPGFEREIAGS